MEYRGKAIALCWKIEPPAESESRGWKEGLRVGAEV